MNIVVCSGIYFCGPTSSKQGRTSEEAAFVCDQPRPPTAKLCGTRSLELLGELLKAAKGGLDGVQQLGTWLATTARLHAIEEERVICTQHAFCYVLGLLGAFVGSLGPVPRAIGIHSNILSTGCETLSLLHIFFAVEFTAFNHLCF